MINQHGGAVKTRVVDQFNAEDIGAPFKIILKDCVAVTSDAETGDMISYKIPDFEGLLRTVVLTRILHPRKLSGADIKFLRKAAGVKQKDLAKSIEMEPETLSRCEAGARAMGPASEKLLRLYLFKTVIKHHKIKECEAKRKLESAMDDLFDVLTPVSVFDADKELVMVFHRNSSLSEAQNDNDANDEEGWDAEKEPSMAIA